MITNDTETAEGGDPDDQDPVTVLSILLVGKSCLDVLWIINYILHKKAESQLILLLLLSSYCN